MKKTYFCCVIFSMSFLLVGCDKIDSMYTSIIEGKEKYELKTATELQEQGNSVNESKIKDEVELTHKFALEQGVKTLTDSGTIKNHLLPLAFTKESEDFSLIVEGLALLDTDTKKEKIDTLQTYTATYQPSQELVILSTLYLLGTIKDRNFDIDNASETAILATLFMCEIVNKSTLGVYKDLSQNYNSLIQLHYLDLLKDEDYEKKVRELETLIIESQEVVVLN